MKSKTPLILFILLVLAILLSACTGAASVATSWPGLSAIDGTAYLSSGQFVYAINVGNGSELWHYPTETVKGLEFYATPALSSDGQVIVGGFDKKLYSLDAKTGQQRWVFEDATDRYVAGALVTEKGIYAPSSDGYLYALDLNGQSLWAFETQEAIWGTPTSNSECDCIYVASMDRHVYAINASTGAELWQSPELSGSIIGSPTYDAENKLLYIGTIGEEMIALDAESGEVRWRVPTDDWIWAGPLLLDGALYFGDEMGNFYALNAADGTQIWKIQPLPESPIVSSPALEADVIYYTTESATIYGINPAGTISSTFTVAGKLYTSPVWADGSLLVAEMQGDALMVALNENGAQQWAFLPSK